MKVEKISILEEKKKSDQLDHILTSPFTGNTPPLIRISTHPRWRAAETAEQAN